MQLIQSTDDTFATVVYRITDILQGIFPILIGMTVVVFLYGLMKYIFSLGSAKDHSQGQAIMIAGVVALFVVSTFWGLVAIIQNTIFG